MRIEKVDQLEAGASIASCERTDDSAGKTIAAGVNLFDPIDQARPSKSLFALRDNEPGYALLKDPQTQERNRYGERIALFDLVDEAISLNINGVREVGFNPNRNKQHAFHFTADNCIGHACESACSEKNDLPPHLSFRSVGYVEGGTFPNYTRMNISMACNHCDDPVCLEAFDARLHQTPEYGAVIQDPDICFGCGYCTWVCPYNAPQLDPGGRPGGEVQYVRGPPGRGLKPACVSACLGNALNFGVVENTPDNREQIETQIPGFPDPAITRPNIRFQQIKTLPREMTRTDSMLVKYRKDDKAGVYKPTVDQKSGRARYRNLARLSSREKSVGVVYPRVAGGDRPVCADGIGYSPSGYRPSPVTPARRIPPPCCSAWHWLHSGCSCPPCIWASRCAFTADLIISAIPGRPEGAGVAAFMAFAGLHMPVLAQAPWLVDEFPVLATSGAMLAVLAQVCSVLALLGAGVGLYYMVRCYRIKARPFWDHKQTGFAFVGCSLYLGASCLALVGGSVLLLAGESAATPGDLFRIMARDWRWRELALFCTPAI